MKEEYLSNYEEYISIKEYIGIWYILLVWSLEFKSINMKIWLTLKKDLECSHDKDIVES